MLQDMGHFSSRLAFEMRPRQKCQLSRIFPKFWADRGQSSCLRKWPVLIANRGPKLTKSWGKSGPQEEAGDITENVPF